MRSGILIAVFIFAFSVAGYSQAVARGDADSKCGWKMPQLAASSPKPSYARYNFAEGTVGVMCFEENQTYGIESDDDHSRAPRFAVACEHDLSPFDARRTSAPREATKSRRIARVPTRGLLARPVRQSLRPQSA